MNYIKVLKSYVTPVLLILFGGILEFLTFSNTKFPLWLIGILVMGLGTLQFIDKINSNRDFTEKQTQYTADIASLKKTGEEQKTMLEDQKKTSEQQIELIKEMGRKMDEQQKARMNLVAKLMERGLISEADVIKHLDGADAFLLYCYANPSSVSDGKDILRRSYPVFLQKVGFVRLGKRSGFFITIANRLTKRLQNPNALKEWLLRELKNELEIDWRAQLEKLRMKESILYERYKNDNYSKHLSMDILVFKTRLSSGNIGIINKNILPTEFTKLMGTDIKPGKLVMEEEKMIQVKKFVFESSFQLFFSEIAKDDLKKLSKLEPKLKQQLNINSFIGYTTQAVDDIKRVFQVSFDDSKALEYATLLKSQVKEYEEALKEMGISTD